MLNAGLCARYKFFYSSSSSYYYYFNTDSNNACRLSWNTDPHITFSTNLVTWWRWKCWIIIWIVTAHCSSQHSWPWPITFKTSKLSEVEWHPFQEQTKPCLLWPYQPRERPYRLQKSRCPCSQNICQVQIGHGLNSGSLLIPFVILSGCRKV